jgi:hypothetical protein
MKKLITTSRYTVRKINKDSPLNVFIPKSADNGVIISINTEGLSLFNTLLFNKNGDLSNLYGNEGCFKKTNKSVDEVFVEYQKLVDVEFEKLRKIINPNEKTN